MKLKNIMVVAIIVAAFIAFFVFVYQPYAKQQSGISRMADDLKPSYLLKEPFSKIPDFGMIDQNGDSVFASQLDGTVHVADFFFSSCEAICPMMSTQLSRVQEAMGDEEDFRILSFSLDSENDSVPVLKSFARKFGAKDPIWHLLTGNKEEIYQLGREGYMQAVLVDSNGVINHPPRFVLVDENRQIRGFYNGLDSVEVDYLINDLSYLLYKEKKQ